MAIVASNSLTLSNVNDGTITHHAYAYSADGTNGFTTVYPNLNLLDGTKDFSGDWGYSSSWVTDGTYKGLTVKKRTASQYLGIYKTFTAPKDGTYTFSAYIKSSGNTANIRRYGGLNSKPNNATMSNYIGNNFDWTRDSVTLNLKANDTVWIRYEITGNGTDSIVWVAGYKWEQGSTATPWMPSSSEATTADYPSYIGQYTDFTSTASTDPAKYAPWTIFKGNDGKDGANGKDGIAGKDGVGLKTTVITYAISTSGTTAPTTGWTSSVPSLIKGQYLWTKTVWTYTDNSSETGYSVTYISKDGNNGNDGIAGKDGTGIKTTTITYAGSTSGTTAPTSGWTSTIPTVAAGSYLWTKTVWTYTDNTSETGYSVAKMGNTGPTGPSGVDGNPGKVIQQNTEPTNKFLDMLWQYTGAEPLNATGITAQPNMTYVWNGTSWQIWFLNPANLQAVNAWITNAMIANAAIDFAKINSATIENLSAVNVNLGNVKAGKITNEFDYKGDDGKQYKGTTVYDSHKILMDYTIDGQGGMTLSLSPEGLIIKGNTGGTGGSYALDLTKEGLNISAGPLGNVNLTPGGLVFSSDTELKSLTLNGVVTAKVYYQRKNGTVFVKGGGNWGNFPDNKTRTLGTIPEGFRPPSDWGAGMNPQGGSRLMSVKINTAGDVGITSDAAQNNVYGEFSMSYPVE